MNPFEKQPLICIVTKDEMKTLVITPSGDRRLTLVKEGSVVTMDALTMLILPDKTRAVGKVISVENSFAKEGHTMNVMTVEIQPD